MKKIFLVLLIVVLLASSINALSFDNIKSYDQAKKEITIKNAFGLPLISSDLATYKLTYNSDACLINCEARGTTTIYASGRLFDRIKYLKIDNKEVQIDTTNVYIKQVREESYTIPTLEKVCSPTEKNGTSCRDEVVSESIKNTTEDIWILYNGEILPPSVYDWKIAVKKPKDLNVDWIASAYGNDLKEWAWWDNDWSKKKAVYINNSLNQALENYPVYLNVSYESSMLANFSDIRFLDTTETSELTYYHLDGVNSDWARMFVLLNFTANENKTIYLYYGNPAAATLSTKTGIIYDDFENGTLDVNKAYFSRPACDGGSAWAETGGKATASCTMSTKNWNFGYQLINQTYYNWSKSYIEFQATSYIQIDPNRLNIWGWAPGNIFNGVSGQFLWGDRETTTASYFNTLNNWTYEGGDIRIQYDGNNLGTIAFNGSVAVSPTMAGQGGSNQEVAMELSNVWAYNFLVNEPLYDFGEEQTDSFITLNIEQVSPADNFNSTSSHINFVTNVSVSLTANLTNITTYVYSPSGALFTSSSLEINGTFNQSSTGIGGLVLGSGYKWNALACAVNTTSTGCLLSGNQTFSVVINETAIHYTTPAFEGTSNLFMLNVTIPNTTTINSLSLNYNNTNYSVSSVLSGPESYSLTRIITAPLVGADTDIPFYFTINGINTTLLNQTVLNVNLDNCSSYTNKLLNISLFDERERNSLNGTIEVLYTVLDKPTYNEIQVLSGEFIDVTNTLVCSQIDLSGNDFAYSAQIKYYAENYSSELYNIQRADLTNTTTSLNLYDLDSDHSTDFKIIYQDNTFSFVEDAIIQLQRLYLPTGNYEIVEAPLTSNEGAVVLHIDLDSNRYRATVVKNGEVLDEYNNLVFVCSNPLIGDCTQKLIGEVNPGNSVPLNNLQDFVYSDPTINNQTITISYSVPSGSPSAIGISLVQKDQFGNETLCDQSITSSAGSVECEFSETIGDSYVDLVLTKNGVIMLQQSYIIPEDGALNFLGNNFFIVLLLMLSLVGMSFTSPEWIIVNGVLTFIISGALWLLSGLNFVVGLGSLMWLVIAACILIFKLAKQEDR